MERERWREMSGDPGEMAGDAWSSGEMARDAWRLAEMVGDAWRVGEMVGARASSPEGGEGEHAVRRPHAEAPVEVKAGVDRALVVTTHALGHAR